MSLKLSGHSLYAFHLKIPHILPRGMELKIKLCSELFGTTLFYTMLGKFYHEYHNAPNIKGNEGSHCLKSI